ncbi:hypothetical protein P3T21_004250 [Paraburkholderia sp. GAS334]
MIMALVGAVRGVIIIVRRLCYTLAPAAQFLRA